MIITMMHMRTIPIGTARGYCITGAKRFFSRYELDWKEFVKNGLPEEQFLNTNDALAINLVKHAHNIGEQ